MGGPALRENKIGSEYCAWIGVEYWGVGDRGGFTRVVTVGVVWETRGTGLLWTPMERSHARRRKYYAGLITSREASFRTQDAR